MRQYAQTYRDELKRVLDALDPIAIEKVTNIILDAYKNDKQVFIIGNGGSASAASHMACDLGKNTAIGTKRRLRVTSLTDNMAWFSAVANDVGYENVFMEQLKNTFNAGDVLIGISGSGNSPNVVNAMEWANDNGGITVAIVAFTGGPMKEAADVHIHIDTHEYGPAEDVHLIINHMIVGYILDRWKIDHELEQPAKTLKTVDGELVRK